MGEKAKPDFSGYATKAGLKCSDGRIITPDAFRHQDGITVPLVWQHNHDTPDNVLGHAVLEHREDGIYTYAYFNTTAQANNAKTLVEHKDITSLSIYANQLIEKSKQVLHGVIREVSLVLSGANPGALIDNITLVHGDGDPVTLDDEAVIYTGLELKHSDEPGGDDSDDDKSDDDKPDDDKPDDDKQESLTPDNLSDAVAQGVTKALTDMAHNDKEGRRMTRNVFEQQNGGKTEKEKHVLTHDAMKGIVADAQKLGSLRAAVEGYAIQHGIEDIDILFPDARTVADSPEFDKRRTEWVASVLDGTRHSPFSRIKSIVADITHEEARARGYIKGNLKKEEFFGLATRKTTPATIYKKQKLDRDDIVDITDMDVVTWLKAEMRLMLEEELARAILIGDGRAVDDEDKIKDPAGSNEGAGIRSILNDDDLYAATITVDDSATTTEQVDGIIRAKKFYKGSGTPTFYTTLEVLTEIMLTRDEFGHRLWKTTAELAGELGVDNIVTVEVMEDVDNLLGIIVNLSDYTIGTDKGGETTFFDDFDIDYNQYKYLYETRLSGALTRIRSAMVIMKAASGGTLATPVMPDFTDNVVTVATTTGITYKNKDTDATLTTGSPVTLTEGQSLTVEAHPNSGYYFASNEEDEWTFDYETP